MHLVRDSTDGVSENLCIASISLGAARDFVLSHKKKPHDVEGEKYKKRWALADGSLVLMQGSTQKYWKHEIVRSFRCAVMLAKHC